MICSKNFVTSSIQSKIVYPAIYIRLCIYYLCLAIHPALWEAIRCRVYSIIHLEDLKQGTGNKTDSSALSIKTIDTIDYIVIVFIILAYLACFTVL